MIVLVVIFLMGLVACWFALEGIRQRVHRLELEFADRIYAPAKKASLVQRDSVYIAPPEAGPHSRAPQTFNEPNLGRQQPEIPVGSFVGVEWEKVIGGSWLNKLGVLVFVIGVGLLLRYSFGDMGPAGRILVGALISISMLGAGVILERRRDYPVYYGRGLIGGGWAALYFTTYAAHAIESARIIESSTLATLLLMAVACGMILHSLRYRSEVVTGVAYFVAFATLAISPMTTFAVVASVPLAVSLVFLAHRFDWDGMAVAGLVVTYSAYLFSTAGLAPSSCSDQAVLTIYWLIFEALDVISLARNRDWTVSEKPIPIALFPLNACGFVGASLLRWDATTPLYFFLGTSALLFLADALLRAWFRPPSRTSDWELTFARSGRGYEGSLAAAAALASATVFERFTGLRLDVALMLEAEMLIIAGVQLELLFPAVLGTLLMLLPISRIVLLDSVDPKTVTVAVFMIRRWSLVATLAAGTLYVDRSLLDGRWGTLFGYPAALILLLVIGVEVSTAYQGLAWLVLGLGLFHAGLTTRKVDLRFQGYVAISLGIASLLLLPIFGSLDVSGFALCIGAILTYPLAVETWWLDVGVITETERYIIRRFGLWAGTALVATLLWHELPISLVAVGWSIFALALITIGTRYEQRELRLQSYAIALLAFVRCWQVNFDINMNFLGYSESVVTSAMVIALLYAPSLLNLRARRPGVEPAGEFQRSMVWIDSRGSAIFGGLAVVLLTALLYRKICDNMLTEVWALEGLTLVGAGFMKRDRLARLSGLALLGVCVIKLFLYDLNNLGTVPRIFSFMILGLLLLGVSLVYARFYEKVHPYLLGDGKN